MKVVDPYTQDDEVIELIDCTIREHCPLMSSLFKAQIRDGKRGILALMQLAFLAGLKVGRQESPHGRISQDHQ